MLEKSESDLSLTEFVQKAQRKHASSTHQDFCSQNLDFTMSASLLTGTGKTELLLELHFCSWKGSTCESSTAVFISSRTGSHPIGTGATPTQLHSPQSASSYRGRPPILTQQRIPQDCVVHDPVSRKVLPGHKPQCGDLASSCSLSPRLRIPAASLPAAGGVSSAPHVIFLVCVSGFKFSLFIRTSVILI